MELYGKESKSIPQKIIIIILELLLIYVSYWILFQGGGTLLFEKVGIATTTGNATGRKIIFVFSLIIFARMTLMMVYLLRRKMPWEETLSVPMAFALYYIGFSLLVYKRTAPVNWLDYIAIAIFLFGSFLNTFSELQRHFWKKRPGNNGRLYTQGLFNYSMHINYFGDLLWVSACAIITFNPYAAMIPLFLFCFFVFYNIPKLDTYLAGKYKSQFVEYQNSTSRLIPFIY